MYGLPWVTVFKPTKKSLVNIIADSPHSWKKNIIHAILYDIFYFLHEFLRN